MIYRNDRADLDHGRPCSLARQDTQRTLIILTRGYADYSKTLQSINYNINQKFRNCRRLIVVTAALECIQAIMAVRHNYTITLISYCAFVMCLCVCVC